MRSERMAMLPSFVEREDSCPTGRWRTNVSRWIEEVFGEFDLLSEFPRRKLFVLSVSTGERRGVRESAGETIVSMFEGHLLWTDRRILLSGEVSM